MSAIADRSRRTVVRLQGCGSMKKRLRVVICLVVGLILVGLGLNKLWWCLTDSEFPDNTSLLGISTASGLKFPRSALLVHGNSNPCRCDLSFITALITIDRSEVDHFIDPLLLSMHMSRKRLYQSSFNARLYIPKHGRDSYSRCLPSWWTPDKPHKFLAIAVPRPRESNKARDLYMVIGLDDARRSKIYLIYGYSHP